MLASPPALPIVDISPFMPGSATPSARARAAEALDAACCDVGFFYLEGHGVPQADIEGLHRLSREFFHLPQAEKDAVALSRYWEGARGYQRLGENVTQGLRDWHEALDFYAEPKEGDVDWTAASRPPGATPQEHLESMRRFALAPNQWPSSPPGFREAAEEHFRRMAVVGDALMEAMALALGLPDGYFRPLTDRSFWCARIIGYPALPERSGSTSEVGTSVGEHTDYGCWTLLAQDSTPGALEVRLADGSWTKAEPRPGALVVNLGDMLSVWTKGRFVATPHRVRQAQAAYRTSIAYFHDPNLDAAIYPLEATTPARPRRPGTTCERRLTTAPLQRAADGGALVYGEHLFAKVSSNFDFRPVAG